MLFVSEIEVMFVARSLKWNRDINENDQLNHRFINAT